MTGLRSTTRAKRVALGSLFGVLIFLSKVLLPSPVDKMFVVAQALLLALGFLVLGPPGATYTGIIGGLLTALWRAPMAPVTVAFSFLYGFLVDGLGHLLRVRTSEGNVKTSRLVVSITVSTGIVGLLSYYLTVFPLGLLPRNPILEAGILIAGLANGFFGGYFAAQLWNKKIKNIA